MSKYQKTDITSRQLRAAARAAWKLDAFLYRCNDEGVLNLMGFDLDWLADQFNKAAAAIDKGESSPDE